MKVLLFSRYARLGASSRLRSIQYIPYLGQCGINVELSPLFPDSYVRALYGERKRPAGVIASSYGRRILALTRAARYDLIWIEKELLPWLPAWFERLLRIANIPYLVDYDDAIFHNYDLHRSKWVRRTLGRKIDAVMRAAVCVTAGNEYLGQRAMQAGARRVENVPTVVDLERYAVREHVGDGEMFTVGWVGSPSTEAYLELIYEPLRRLGSDKDIRLIAVGASELSQKGVNLDIRGWAEETEAEDIRRFDAGVMPLPDEPWERGKCGYKIIQYMASGVPVVASPVGINKQLVEHGANGFLAVGADDWEKYLRLLRDDVGLRKEMGERGRAKVESTYSLQAMAPKLCRLLESLVRN